MKRLICPMIAGRVLEVNISLRDERFTPRDSRTWRAIADKILERIARYDVPVQELFDAQEDVALDPGLSPEERQGQLRRITQELRDLDTTVGALLVMIDLEETEYTFINTHWWNVKLPGDRKNAALVEQVSTMIEKAVTLVQKDGAWIPAEHADVPVNGRGPRRRESLGRR